MAIRGEILQLLRTDRKRGGTHRDTLRNAGLPIPSAYIQQMRRDGYRIDVVEDMGRGGAEIRLAVRAAPPCQGTEEPPAHAGRSRMKGAP